MPDEYTEFKKTKPRLTKEEILGFYNLDEANLDSLSKFIDQMKSDKRGSPEGYLPSGEVLFFDEYDMHLECARVYKETEEAYQKRIQEEWMSEQDRLISLHEATKKHESWMLLQIREKEIATLKNLMKKYEGEF